MPFFAPAYSDSRPNIARDCLICFARRIYRHPYNPLKSLTHPFPDAPNGTVVLTRSAVLALCGWSNTQFSYWARRAEAVSVLAPQDRRLRAVARALGRELRAAGVVETAKEVAGKEGKEVKTEDGDESADAPADGNETAGEAAVRLDEEGLEEEWLDMYVTGKGLDSIIEEVKRRTGASQFLRGRHSSLDPFSVSPHAGPSATLAAGTHLSDGAGADADGAKRKKEEEELKVYVPTFQADPHAFADRDSAKNAAAAAAAAASSSASAHEHDQKRKAQTLDAEAGAVSSNSNTAPAVTNAPGQPMTTASMMVMGGAGPLGQTATSLVGMGARPTTGQSTGAAYNRMFEMLDAQTQELARARVRHAHSRSLPLAGPASASASAPGQPFPGTPARRVSFELSDSRSPVLAGLAGARAHRRSIGAQDVYGRSLLSIPAEASALPDVEMAMQVAGIGPGGLGPGQSGGPGVSASAQLPPRKKRRSM